MTSSSSDWPVHQLWPPSRGKQRTELDVVLFHGLQLTANGTSHAWSSTWTQQGHDDVCWAQEWLPYDLGEAVRIFSMSYNAHVVTSPHDHVSEIAHNVFVTLMDPRYEWHQPIVLIGHSFGGLVLKSLVVKLKRESTVQNPTNSWSRAIVQRAKLFLRNVRGVAFYAVPHAGSTNFPKYVNKLRHNNRHHRGIMDNIRPWQRDMEQLSVDFDPIVTENEINGILVKFCSAQRSAGAHCYMVEDANHMEVCKPPSKEHPSYALLLQFIITCVKERRRCYQPSQEFHDLPQSMFGLDSYVGSVEMLLTSEGSDEVPRYVGVWGMGGVGKTLLLKRVYCSPSVQDYFQGANFIWLTVGKTPNVMALYRSLSKELGCKPEKNLNRDDYKHKLHSQLGQRRVCLVLDDVWEDEVFESLDFAKGEGSVTLLSTRNQSLLKRASPHISQVHMTPLSKEDSWSLFCVHAFRPPSEVPCELKDLAEAMAKECKGLPLALKVIGRAMFGKALPADWKFLLQKLTESRMHKGEVVVRKLYDRLKLGYDCLSDDDQRLQRCFIYFAAFPEDFEISFNRILWHWIGERLVPDKAGDDAEADARSLLNKLLERCFIERKGSEFVGVWRYKLHDVMRDLAIIIVEAKSPAKQHYLYRAGQNLEAFPKEWMGSSKARSLSLYRNKLSSLPLSFHAPRLVSLFLGWNQIDSLPSGFLGIFRKLRILDLSGGKFSNLPEELGELEHLVSLDLSDCDNLKTLPDAVGKLHMLKHLNVNSCENLKYLPSRIVGLTSLEELDTRFSDGLRWVGHTPSWASVDDICKFRFLTQLTIFGTTDAGELPHSISALTNLKVLWIGLENVKILPSEMAYWFKQLQDLKLFLLFDLEELPSSFTSCGAFPALITFEISMCGRFVRFPKVEKGALPKLQILHITMCKSLETLPHSLKHLTSLTKLKLLVMSALPDKLSIVCKMEEI